MYALGFVVLYIILTLFTKRITDSLVWQIPYKIKFKFAEKGFLLKDDPKFEKKDILKIGLLTYTCKILSWIPLINIAVANILTEESIKTYLSGKYFNADVFYLSKEDRNEFLNAKDFSEKSYVIDKVTIDMGLAYFASHFKTSVIVNGILSLNCQLCPLSYTLEEINLIASKLDSSVTFGKINGLPVALIGARIFRNIKTFDNQIYEISNDFSTIDHFKVYLIGKEDLTDKDIDNLVDIVRNKRKEGKMKEFSQMNLNSCLVVEREYSPVDEIKLEKRL